MFGNVFFISLHETDNSSASKKKGIDAATRVSLVSLVAVVSSIEVHLIPYFSVRKTGAVNVDVNVALP